MLKNPTLATTTSKRRRGKTEDDFGRCQRRPEIASLQPKVWSMTGYMGEGLIKCHDCGAMVPSFESLIDLPGAPEHMTTYFKPDLDPAMHTPDCTYCVRDSDAHLPIQQREHLERLYESIEKDNAREREERDAFTITALLDLVNDHAVAHTEDLLKVAEMGKLLFDKAIWLAADQDNAEFFLEVYGLYGPVVDACLEEMDLDYRDTMTGRRLRTAD